MSSLTPRADDSKLLRKDKDIVTRLPTTRQLTPDDEERAAVELARKELAILEDIFGDKQRGVITLKAPTVRLLLARATRPHD
jgi:hypothetical protein